MQKTHMLADLLRRIAYVRRVLQNEEDDDASSPLPPSFWDEHRAAMARFRGEDEARALERRLRAVAARVMPYEDASATTTRVDAEGVLCFEPLALLDEHNTVACPRAAQAAALRVMHAHAIACDATRVRVDLRALTWARAAAVLRASTDEDAAAGALLWATLPTRVRETTVLLPQHMRGTRLLAAAVRAALPAKVRARTRFV